MLDDELPSSWTIARLEDLGRVLSGGTPSTKEPSNFDGDIPWVTPADLTGYTAKLIYRGRRNITRQGLEGSSARLLPKGSVLFSSRAPIGYVAIAANELATNQGFKSLALYDGFDPEYVYHYLKSAKRLAEGQASGTTFKEISGSRFAQLPIPVPPLPEQRRIVERIETLFARLDKGEEAVRQVHALLKRYRQSVLKAAVTGELTADWREANRDRLEHGRDLLARILKTRRKTWEGRGRYKEPVAPDTSGLPELPEGWVWASLGQLLSKIEAGKNVRCDERPPSRNEVGIVKISAVTWGVFDEAESKTIISPSHINPRLRIHRGDLLISRANTLELVGASVVVGAVTGNLQLSDKVLRLKLLEPLEHWVNAVLRSALGRRQIEAFATGAQMSMRNISQRNIERICIPLPPKLEIEAALAELQIAHANTSHAEATSLSELTRSAALRQSILKQAFSGRLVPQDPSDPPASALLARIRAAGPTKKTQEAKA